MKQKSNQDALIIGVIIAIVLAVTIVLLTRQGGKGKNISSDLSLDQKRTLATDGKYQDKICGISFNYPKNWIKSDIRLPLPRKPLSQATFNELAKGSLPPKNSICSLICYDAKKYSFDQFISQSPFSQGGETISVDNTQWQRLGNFTYTVKNEKLYIFQMFFTKYDLKPEAGYEAVFLNIIKSVRFSVI